MSSRRLITAVVLATAAFGLTACGPDSTSGGSTSTAAAGAPSASSPVSSATPPSTTATGAAPTAGSSTPPASDGDPGMSCTEPKLAPGHKIVMPVRQPTQDLMHAKATKFACDPNDGHYVGVGAEKSYLFAPEVKAQLATGAGTFETVVVGDLWMHIGDCLGAGSPVKPPLSCSSYPAYEIALDSSGKVTEIKEIWHS